MTFLEAIRKSKWIRRHGYTRVYCVPDVPTHLYSVRRADLLADDWEIVSSKDEDPYPEEDASAKRFSLLELDKK